MVLIPAINPRPIIPMADRIRGMELNTDGAGAAHDARSRVIVELIRSIQLSPILNQLKFTNEIK